jgi:outer membrane immunogenic protein
MKSILLAATVLLGLAGNGFAADAVTTTEPAPLPVASTYNWTGAYVGGQVGGAWDDSRWSKPFPFPPAFNINGSGAVYGGQIGYNYQFDKYVIGIEGDFAGSSVKGSKQCFIAIGSVCETKQDYLASIRGRVGYALDRLLIYGDGGIAFTKYKFAETQLILQSFDGGSRVGWTAGLGVEYAFTDHWIAGVEWNYYDFGSKDGQSSRAAAFVVNNRERENVVAARLSYKF